MLIISNSDVRSSREEGKRSSYPSEKREHSTRQSSDERQQREEERSREESHRRVDRRREMYGIDNRRDDRHIRDHRECSRKRDLSKSSSRRRRHSSDEERSSKRRKY